jgi:hypothetical protein
MKKLIILIIVLFCGNAFGQALQKDVPSTRDTKDGGQAQKPVSMVKVFGQSGVLGMRKWQSIESMRVGDTVFPQSGTKGTNEEYKLSEYDKTYTNVSVSAEICRMNKKTGISEVEFGGEYVYEIPVFEQKYFGVTDDSLLVFYEMWAGLEYKIEPIPLGKKETLTLVNEKSQRRFEWYIEANMDIDRLFGLIQPVWAVDAKGNEVAVEDTIYGEGDGYFRYVLSVLPTEKTIFPVQVDPTVQWQSGAAYGKDSYLKSNMTTTNYGTNAWWNTTTISSGSITRAIIEFDSLSVIPVGSIIDSAFFTVTIQGTGSGSQDSTLSLRRLTKSWSESVVCWDSASAGVLWSTAGGDFGSNKYGTRTIDTTKAVNDTVIFNVKTLIDTLLNKGLSNYGWMLKFDNDGVSTSSYRYFYSSDATTAVYRPKLIIYYKLILKKPYNTSATAISYNGFSISATDSSIERTKLYLITGGTKVDSVTNAGPTPYIWNFNYSNLSWQPNSTHTFYVSVTNSVGDTVMSSAFYGTTMNAFTNFALNALSISSIRASWDTTTGGADSFYVAQAIDTTAVGDITILLADTINGLATGSQYSYVLVAIDGGNEYYSSITNCWTLPAVPVIDSLRGWTNSSVFIQPGYGTNSDSITIAIRDSTRHKWITAAGDTSTSAVWRKSAQWGNFVIPKLTAGTLYKYALKAKTGDDSLSAFTVLDSARTYEPIDSLYVTYGDTTKLTVYFGGDSCIAPFPIGYLLYNSVNGKIISDTISYSAGIKQAVTDDTLGINRQYKIKVKRIENADSTYICSLVDSGWTDAQVPGIVLANAVNDTTLVIKIDPKNNPAYTLYNIRDYARVLADCTAVYIDTSGFSAVPVWRTYQELGSAAGDTTRYWQPGWIFKIQVQAKSDTIK